MTTLFRQDARLGRLATVLGDDVLVLVQFTGTEAINALFEFQVDCMASDPELDFDSLLGTHATVTVALRSGAFRAIDGIVAEVRWLGPEGPGHHYRLTLRPWPHLATLRRNQRIFHDKTVVQIVTEVLGAYAATGALKTTLTQTYPKLEYTVQYRESDFAFVSRMLERFGISYHFVHRPGAHDMVLTDAPDAHPKIGMRPYKPAADRHQQDVEHFHSWTPSRRITTGAIRLTDYNFKTPHAKMEARQAGTAVHAQGGVESFDYPGDYLSPSRGKAVALLRDRQERGQDQRFVAAGDIPDLAAGAVVTLGGEVVPGSGQDFVCLSAEHRYAANAYGAGDKTGDSVAYQGRYVLLPVTAPLHPERKTRRARVDGPQTARVVGEGEIDCDEYGRILVRFHWDLDDAYSMRCRVSQNWAGNGWGGMVIPRIGMEVVVEFLEGDPDQPLVTGCVYNGHNKVPYKLPENKTISTFRTDTHEGDGFNELRFEDQAGREEIYVHAQKDRNEKTRNNHSERIDNNWVQSIGHNKAIEVTNHHEEIIGGNMSIYVGPSNIGTLVGQMASKLTQGLGKVAANLGFARALPFSRGNYVLGVEKSKSEAIGLSSNEVVGVSKSVLAGKHIQLNSGDVVTVHAGNLLTLDAGEFAELTGAQRTEVKAGIARIVLEMDGTVGVYGKKIHIGATEVVTIDATDEVSIRGGKINLN
ncbi:MAG: type VI secretion system tip protein VgrG [Rhodobacteraceae bacterium]|jgi:type VI secretion system secreted protein VgrG|nr:type VI secretion system tip protein VgrG [Paracoccaceae bacterium]